MNHEPILARPRRSQEVLGARIAALDWDTAIATLLEWGRLRAPRYACLCNVHSVVTSSRDPVFSAIINNADLAAPDGAPIAWAVGRLAGQLQPRINGPDMMLRYMAAAQECGQSIYLYGGAPATLDALQRSIARDFPRLRIAGAYAPPFRPLSDTEDQAVVDAINGSGAHMVFVGLGCPKQELWMGAHCGRVRAPMVGVGAAFDYHAGLLRRAPPWWRQHGLEWLYRLAMEPRRLARRYLVTNTLFILGLARQIGQRRRLP
jgi:N-acetylglucosaminyldiphosphoundecaprenol N-acetyl-beta-D-mannosaminyltransferase